MSGSSSNIKTQNLGRQVHLDDVFWYQFDGEHWSPITLTAEPETSSAVKMLELAARQNVTITRGVTLTFLSSFSVGCCTRARTHTHTHTHTQILASSGTHWGQATFLLCSLFSQRIEFGISYFHGNTWLDLNSMSNGRNAQVSLVFHFRQRRSVWRMRGGRWHGHSRRQVMMLP